MPDNAPFDRAWLAEFWRRSCQALGATDAASIAASWAALEAMYHHPPRAYHNLGHIQDCLRALSNASPRTISIDTIALVSVALFAHDCVYDSTRPDNEQRSADVAVVLGRGMGIPPTTLATVHRLIMATTHKGLPGDAAEALIRDIDLSSLGASPEKFDANTAAIRAEYAWADDEQWRHGRVAFFKEILARPAIYSKPEFHARFESAARANVQRALHSMAE